MSECAWVCGERVLFIIYIYIQFIYISMYCIPLYIYLLRNRSNSNRFPYYFPYIQQCSR